MLSMLRFSVRMLLIAVAATAIATFALVNASGTWARLVFAVAVAANIATVIGAVLTRRPGFVGFAISGWAYLLLTATPMLGLRAEWLQPPAKLIALVQASVARPVAWEAGGLETDFNLNRGDFVIGPTDPTTGKSTLLWPNPRHMQEVAHGLCCLTAGVLGSWYARWLSGRHREDSP